MYKATNEQSLNLIFDKYMFYLYASSVCRITDLTKQIFPISQKKIELTSMQKMTK